MLHSQDSNLWIAKFGGPMPYQQHHYSTPGRIWVINPSATGTSLTHWSNINISTKPISNLLTLTILSCISRWCCHAKMPSAMPLAPTRQIRRNDRQIATMAMSLYTLQASVSWHFVLCYITKCYTLYHPLLSAGDATEWQQPITTERRFWQATEVWPQWPVLWWSGIYKEQTPMSE